MVLNLIQNWQLLPNLALNQVLKQVLKQVVVLLVGLKVYLNKFDFMLSEFLKILFQNKIISFFKSYVTLKESRYFPYY